MILKKLSVTRAVLLQLRWLMLAFASGIVNTGGFLACGRFVSHVTGFATLFGMNIARWQWVQAASVFTVPLFFLVGGLFSAWMVDRRIQRGQNPFYALPLLVVTLLLVTATVGGHLGWFGKFGGEADLREDYAVLVLLCLASGIQNAVVTTATGTILRSSHLTGTTTDLSTGEMRSFLMPKGSIERQLENRLNWMRASTILFFVAGAVVGAFSFAHWQYLGFLIPATISLGVSIRIAIHHR
jgi:uncharacterized membrane protein YoaK (UPF0700 family)